MRYNKTFYQKHGLKITEEPVIAPAEKALQGASERFHRLITGQSVPLTTVIELENHVARYPHVASFKNYLYGAYVRTNQNEKAAKLLEKTLEVHPDYIFAHLNVANRLLEDGNFNKAASILQKPYDVRHFEKNEFIHVSAFKNYYQTAFRIEMSRKNFDEAEDINKILFDYDRKDKQLKENTLILIATRMDSMYKGKETRKEVEIIAKPIRGQYLSDRDGKPVFNHAEIHQLYQFSLENIPKKTIQVLLALPRQSVIQDLEHAMMDAVLRNNYWQDMGWDDDKNAFPIHALYLLTELRAYQSLPVILDFLRQDDDFSEFWVADWSETYFHSTLYLLGNTQFEVLKGFVLEENLSPWRRLLACEVVAQVVMKQPERRGEVLQWFESVIQHHLDHLNNDNLIDSIFLSSLLGDLMHFKAVELEDMIKKLFATGLIDNSFCGDLDAVLKDLNEPINPYYNTPLPVDIYELYSREYENRANKSQIKPDPDMLAELEDPYFKYKTDLLMETMVKSKSYDDDDDDEEYLEPQLPVKRAEPKVGRNDPCPCGSGKKYKKCHGA
jgi:tetratricopeptide (TPR) repeat protein